MHKLFRPTRYSSRNKQRKRTRLSDKKTFEVQSIVSVDDDQSDGSTPSIDHIELLRKIDRAAGSDYAENWEIVEDDDDEDKEEEVEENNDSSKPEKVEKR